MAKKDDSGKYSADNITVLEGLEAVRKRPGMYIGSTGPDGLHHLVREIFDNSRDEAMAGYCNHIEITLLPDNSVRIVDNGRGIPVDKHKQTGKSALETIMTVLHAGGKFGGGAYKISGGLHGVGASVVNALSEFMKVYVHREGNIYFQEYSRGKSLDDVKKIGKSSFNGTIVRFKPDKEIFETVEFNIKRMLNNYRNQAYLVKGLLITIIDARSEEESILDFDEKQTTYFEYIYPNIKNISSMCFEGGILSMVRHVNELFPKIHDKIIYVNDEHEDVQVEIALQYVDDISSRIISFANNTITPEGGMHITGFKTALTRVINKYNKANNIIPEKAGNLTGEDLLEGMTAVISVKMPEIQFEGQTKTKLGSPSARTAVENVFAKHLEIFLEENPSDAKAILKKAYTAMQARKAAKVAKDSVLRKGALEGLSLPGKLADCQTRKMEEAELFIVEGDSAGGTAKQGRDKKTQAVLPMRGKILNVERARLDRMLANNEIRALIIALGVSLGDTLNMDKLRYGKIIIATDADVDGAHIRTLILTLFYRYFPELITSGHVYIAVPPLYKIVHNKKTYYVYNDREKFELLEKLGITEDGSSRNIQRYKGLGEMNADELWNTTMNPETRYLKRVTIEDAEEADRTFDILMGTDVGARKHFIQSNAKIYQ